MIDFDEILKLAKKAIDDPRGWPYAQPLDNRGTFSLYVTPWMMIELITSLREAEKDAARYRWLRDKAYRVHIMDICTRHSAEWDAMVDQAMKEKSDE